MLLAVTGATTLSSTLVAQGTGSNTVLAGTGLKVRFTQFGKRVITTNNADVLQAWTLGTSTSFANLSASAPIAKFISCYLG